MESTSTIATSTIAAGTTTAASTTTASTIATSTSARLCCINVKYLQNMKNRTFAL